MTITEVSINPANDSNFTGVTTAAKSQRCQKLAQNLS